MNKKKTTKPKQIKCYVASYHIPELEPFLKKNEFCTGMILFAIPDFGIMFRCRVDGDQIGMDFGALFSLLKFITSDLKEEKIKDIIVYSSSPEFIFSFTDNSAHLKDGSARRIMLNAFQKKIKFQIGYLEPIKNKALISAADYPSLPESKSINLRNLNKAFQEASFKPFQKGIQL